MVCGLVEGWFINTAAVNNTLALTTVNIAKYQTQNKFTKILI